MSKMSGFVGLSATLISTLGTTNVMAEPITSISEVVGRWTGKRATGGTTEITIGPTGQFVVTSPLGRSDGTARLVGGVLVLPFSNNQGQIKLSKTNEFLEGPFVAGTITGITRVERVSK